MTNLIPIPGEEITLVSEERIDDFSVKKTYSDGTFFIEGSPTPAVEYIGLRKAEYPPITDYLDGVVKGDQEQIQAYIDACLAVKAKYPKP